MKLVPTKLSMTPQKTEEENGMPMGASMLYSTLWLVRIIVLSNEANVHYVH